MVRWLQHRRWIGWAAVIVLLAFALLHLLVRGPLDVQGNFNFCDFASPWASARLWISGENPYDNARLWDTWISGRGSFHTEHEFWLALLPPAGFAALAPFAAMPPGVATAAWTILSIISVVAIIVSALQLASIRASSLTGWLLISFTLASAPIQTLVAVGQVSLPVIACILVALSISRSGHDVSAGVLLGIATALKPQLAGPFLLWYLFFARWRVLGWSLAIAVALTLIAIIPMQVRGIPWLSDWLANVRLSTQPGSPNDPTFTGPWRNQMIDLRVWLFSLLQQRELVVAKGMIVCMLLGAGYVVMLVRLRDERDQLLALATLGALALLPVYHRMYDAALLILALAWALKAATGPLRRPAVATLACLSIFLVPFDLLPQIMQRSAALDGVAQTWVWRVLIDPHHALAALAIAICLMWGMWAQTKLLEARAPAEITHEPHAADQEDEEITELAPTRS